VTIESLSPQLIERYLDSRDLRFYRDHDGKGFLVLLSTKHGKLQVNLRTSGKRGDVLVISVSPAMHYPAAERSRLMKVVNDWNRDTHWPKAFVRKTSQPNRIGVVGETSFPLSKGIHFEAVAEFIGYTTRCAPDLFDKIAEAISLPSTETLERWLDRTA
jgi:Putative bacterial sensory transduction regulator